MPERDAPPRRPAHRAHDAANVDTLAQRAAFRRVRPAGAPAPAAPQPASQGPASQGPASPGPTSRTARPQAVPAPRTRDGDPSPAGPETAPAPAHGPDPGAPGATGKATTAIALAVAAVVLIAALMAPSGSGWRPALLLAPALAAWAIRRACLLAALYLGQMTVYYGLTWLVVGPPASPTMVALVMLWAAGVLLGAYAVHARGGHRDRGHRYDSLGWPQFAVAAGLIALQAALVLNAKMGVAAQLTGGVSTPTGVLGTLTTAAPVVTLMLLVTSLSSGRHTAAATAVVIAEVVVLALSGFRGSAVLFVIAVFTVAALRLPRQSPWRRPRRVAAASLALLAVAVVGFIGAANVKSEAAVNTGLTSAGTELFGLNEALPNIANRLDLRPALQTAVDLRHDPYAADAVSWTFQLQALVPRALWPDKPIIDYGQRVTAEIYGVQNSRSSSTVTTIGDTLINFGTAGVAAGSILLGALLAMLERLARRGRGALGLALAATAAVFVVGQESALILSVTGLIRNLLVSWALWRLAAYLTRPRSVSPIPGAPPDDRSGPSLGTRRAGPDPSADRHESGGASPGVG